MDDILYIPDIHPGDKIFHYTSANALKGICEKEFWATEHGFLNDPNEFNIGTEIFAKIVKEKVSDATLAKKIIEKARDEVAELQRPGNLNEDIAYSGSYIISFCLDEDSMLMWSEYSNFMGYCMKFDFEKLLHSFNKEPDWHGRVIYKPSEQLKYMGNALDEMFKICADEYSLTKWDDLKDCSGKVIHEVSMDFAIVCLFYNMFFKKECFSGEREYRMIFSCIHDKGLCKPENREKQYFRIKDEVLIPYVKEKFNSMDCLESVIIGPKNKSDIAQKGLWSLFRNLGINVDVKKSDVLLRY